MLSKATFTNNEKDFTVQEVSESKIDSQTSVDAGRRDSAGLRLRTKQDIDDTTLFYNEHKGSVEPLDEKGVSRLNRKNFWFLLSQTWWVAFLIHLDKSTLSQASTMGIFKDVSMTKNEYNDLFVLFYTGYLIALWPGAAIAQRVGHKYFISVSLFLWALLLGMHPLVKTGKQMMALRFLLGMVSRTRRGERGKKADTRQTESQIVPSTTVLHQAFFPPKKSPWVQLLWWGTSNRSSWPLYHADSLDL